MSFRDRLDVEALLADLGVPVLRHGGNLKGKCPNPDHDDHKPSWTIVDSPGAANHGAHRCFACGFAGGPWELVQAVRGLDQDGAQQFVTAFILGRPRALDELPSVVIRQRVRRAAEYQLPPGVEIPSVDGTQWKKPFLDYLVRRGVTQEQSARWHLGFATHGPLAWRIVIPVHTRGRLVAHVARAIFAEKLRYHMPTEVDGACPSSAVFGEPRVSPALRTLTIAEGVFSALALERAIAPNPIALLGSDWSAAKAAILTSVPWEHVIIATDPDAAGERVARSIAMSFRKTKISRLQLSKAPDDCGLEELTEQVAMALSAR